MIRTLILLAFGIGVVVLAVNSLRQHRLKERYVILFVLVGIPFVGLAAWPDALATLAGWMDMPYHTVMVLLVVGFLILMLFELLSIVSVQERRITELTQTVGLLREQIEHEQQDDTK